jgi:hypothetical protein
MHRLPTGQGKTPQVEILADRHYILHL